MKNSRTSNLKFTCLQGKLFTLEKCFHEMLFLVRITNAVVQTDLFLDEIKYLELQTNGEITSGKCTQYNVRSPICSYKNPMYPNFEFDETIKIWREK